MKINLNSSVGHVGQRLKWICRLTTWRLRTVLRQNLESRHVVSWVKKFVQNYSCILSQILRSNRKIVGKEEKVRILDSKTNKLYWIPAKELAPGMISTKIKGIEGVVWMEATMLVQNDYQHRLSRMKCATNCARSRKTWTKFFP